VCARVSTGSAVLAVGGSESARRAMQWCANYAPVAGAKVTVVHAVEIGYSFYELGERATTPFVAPLKTAVQLDELPDAIERHWCKPLADAGVSYRVVVANAQAA